MDYIRLSKQVAHALRHAPGQYGLELDRDGQVPVQKLLDALRERGWPGLTEADLEAMLRTSDKRRFEIKDGCIRALYGHSFSRRIPKEPVPPPAILFHGTARRNLKSIMTQGLLPGRRQYVHLSREVPAALQVGRRHDPHPVVLEVAAGQAWSRGIRFYPGNDQVWLADAIPPAYLRKWTKPD